MSENTSFERKGRSGKSLNPLNQFLYDKINDIKKNAETRGQQKIAFCYSKIIRALQKYPIPILSGKYLILKKHLKPYVWKELGRKWQL